MRMNAGVTKLAVLMLPIAAFATEISVATAQTVPPSNVTQRQNGMKAMADAAKRINAMFKGSMPYDGMVVGWGHEASTRSDRCDVSSPRH